MRRPKRFDLPGIYFILWAKHQSESIGRVLADGTRLFNENKQRLFDPCEIILHSITNVLDPDGVRDRYKAISKGIQIYTAINI